MQCPHTRQPGFENIKPICAAVKIRMRLKKEIERESVIAIESDYFFMRHRGVLKYKHYNSQGLLQIRIFFQNSPN